MILDTNGISALFTGNYQLADLMQSARRHHLPVVVIGEYMYGLQRSRNRKRLAFLLASLMRESIILNIEASTCSYYADIRNELRAIGRPIPENDLWIAALSRQHGLPILSCDQHFDRVSGIERLSF